MHAFDYPGAEAFRGRRVLVYGNGVSGLETASDLAPHDQVASAYRKPRYVIQKVVDGVSSDWRWYTQVGALERRPLPPDAWARRLRERIVRMAGNPADFGAPEPTRTSSWPATRCARTTWRRCATVPSCAAPPSRGRGTAGDVHRRVGGAGRRRRLRDGLRPRPPVSLLAGPRPARAGAERSTSAPSTRSCRASASSGSSSPQGPTWPLLELQARWVVAVWSGDVALPEGGGGAHPLPPLDAHNALALTLSEELGVAPDPTDWPELSEPLLFGPMLPPRYRLAGPGAQPEARARFEAQLAASPRAPVDPADVEELGRLTPVTGL